jgi:uncharacterized protein (TIGR02466 family)
MTKIGLQNIFSVPIFTSFLSKTLVDKMEELVIPKLHLLTRYEDQSNDFYDSNRIISPTEVEDLFREIDDKVLAYTKTSNFTTSDKVDYWIQNYQSNDYHRSHSHAHSYISGVYYIRANKNAGSLRFTNPNPYLYSSVYDIPLEDKMYYDIQPQKGLLVIFPSYLIHEVIPSKEKDVERTSLAFNYVH